MKKPSSPSRRKFLRNLAVVAAATVLPQGQALAARPPQLSRRGRLLVQARRNGVKFPPIITPVSRTRSGQQFVTFRLPPGNPGQAL